MESLEFYKEKIKKLEKEYRLIVADCDTKIREELQAYRIKTMLNALDERIQLKKLRHERVQLQEALLVRDRIKEEEKLIKRLKYKAATDLEKEEMYKEAEAKANQEIQAILTKIGA